MNLKILFEKLWNEYRSTNPSAGKIYNLFTGEGETVINDHIAFRTVDHPDVNIDVLSRLFVRNGYVAKGEYHFSDKHLYAKHFELPGDENAPRIFISQLKLNEFSHYLQNFFQKSISMIPDCTLVSPDLIFSGSVFRPLSYEVYKRLREESEYAAWFYVFGFRTNHFTVSVNFLKKYNSLMKVNEFLKQNGFLLNSSGGEIKGTKEELLQQSSTMADIVKVEFEEGEFEIPACYYEFSHRFTGPDGKLFSGFIAKSADRIFESTNFYSKPGQS
jgi:hypothetical protein